MERTLLIATPLYPPEPGGPATYARILEQGLPALGIRPVLVKWSDVRGYSKLLRHLMYFVRVYRAGRKADAVLALDPVSTGLPASIAAALLRKPFYVKVVGDYAWEQGTQRFGIRDPLNAFVRRAHVPFPVAVMRAVQTHVAKRAKRIIVPSEYLKRVIACWGLPEAKAVVIYNSVELEANGSVPAAVAELPRPKVVSIGRLVPWKGVDGVIDAVATQEAPVSLAVVGDGPERASLEAQARQAAPAAHFTGALSHADTLAVLEDADVLVLNSTYEGLSHLLIEALQLGKAIIATDVGGNPELIQHEVNGLLVPPQDTATLSAALARVVAEALLRARLEQGARERGAQFTPEAMLEATAHTLFV